MNYPASKCIQFLDKDIQISKVLQYKKLRAHQQLKSSYTVIEDGGDVLMEHSDLTAGSEGDGHSIAKDIQLEVPELCIPPSQFKKYHTKVYPAQLGHMERALHSWMSSMMMNMQLQERITCIIHGPLALNENLLHFCYACHSAWLTLTNSFL